MPSPRFAKRRAVRAEYPLAVYPARNAASAKMTGTMTGTSLSERRESVNSWSGLERDDGTAPGYTGCPVDSCNAGNCATPDDQQARTGESPVPTRVLLCRHQRMRDGVDRKRDAVLHSYFAHQFRDVRFHGALFNAQS